MNQHQLYKIVAVALAASTVFVLGMLSAKASPVVASFYHEGSRTASGERFHADGMTCAHRTLRFGTRVRVTYHGRSAVCRVTDRGPALWTHRNIDLSRGTARAIGMLKVGVAKIDMVVL